MGYYNLQLIYNFSVDNKKQEREILDKSEEAGKQLENLPHFEVKEIKRQTIQQVYDEMGIGA